MANGAGEFLKDGALVVDWDNLFADPVGRTPEGHHILFQDMEKGQLVLKLRNLSNGSMTNDYLVQNGDKEKGFGPVTVAANLSENSWVIGGEITVKERMYAGRIRADGDVTFEPNAEAFFTIPAPRAGIPDEEKPPPREGQKIWLGLNANPGESNIPVVPDFRAHVVGAEDKATAPRKQAQPPARYEEGAGGYQIDFYGTAGDGRISTGDEASTTAAGFQLLTSEAARQLFAWSQQAQAARNNGAAETPAPSARGHNETGHAAELDRARRTLEQAGARHHEGPDSQPPTTRGPNAGRFGGRTSGDDDSTPPQGIPIAPRGWER